MDPHKTGRQNQAIKKTLSELLHVAVKDPRVGFVTINDVRLNRDHTLARVYYSVLGDDGDKQRSLAGLKKARGFLQGRLGQALRLRQVPELRFYYDDSLDRSLGLENVLKDLEEKGEFEDEVARKRKRKLADLQPPDDLIATLCGGENFWVAPHWNPDPDAMGCALALGFALRAMGKEALVLSYADPPIGLTDLPGYDEVVLPDEAAPLLEAAAPDILVLVDCHRIDRCGPLTELLARIPNVWTIDHHLISGRQAAAPGWVEAKACSAATLVYQVIAELATGAQGHCTPFELDLEMATCLYAGILNDTGGFRFANTTPVTFELAQLLARMGVDTAAVARHTLHRYRPEGVALLQRVLASMILEADGRIVVMRVDQEMVSWTGAVLADTEGFVNIATAIEGIEYVILMKELEDRVWRVSLRAPGGGDVQEVASNYGGGGHRQAAGCTMHGRAEEVATQLVSELQAKLE